MSPGSSIEELLEGSNIDDLQLNTPDGRTLPWRKSGGVLSNALANTNEEGLGLRVGQQARFSDFGVLGYAVFQVKKHYWPPCRLI